MGWKERAESYKSIGPTKQRYEEEFVARKIVRGLGWAEKLLPMLYKEVGYDYDPSMQTWDMAIDILNSVSSGMFDADASNYKFFVDLRKINLSKSFLAGETVGDFCKMALEMPEGGGGLIMFRHPKDVKRCMTMVVFHEAKDMYIPDWLLAPVSTVVRREGPVSVWIRDTMNLIADMSKAFQWEIPLRPAIEE